MRRLSTLFWRWWYRYRQGPSKYTKDEALEIAKQYHMESEVATAMQNGCTADEALQEWDIYPFNI
jgi:hypothetical protein